MDKLCVSVLIFNWNTCRHLSRCIRLLTHYALRITPEVIIGLLDSALFQHSFQVACSHPFQRFLLNFMGALFKGRAVALV